MSNKDYPVPKYILPKHQKLMTDIGNQLKKLREEKKLKSGELASKIEIGRNTYTRIEQGEIYFKFSTLLSILDYHKVSIWDFFKDLKK
jgi:transcriptional regulator with XRE-family HTH domain